MGGWFYIGVSLVSCVHSLILLNNSVQVYVISALELKFGHRNGVSQWVYELTNNIECEVGGKGVGSSSEKFHVHTESQVAAKVQNVSIQRSIVKNQWGEMDMLPNSRIHNTLKLKL